MIARLIEWCGRRPVLVILASLALAMAGAWAAWQSPLDAVPDLSDPQVIVFSEWMGRSPQLVEEQVTYPLVTGLQSLPGVKAVRGFTMFGMSFTYVLLQDGVDPYWARSRVTERLQQLRTRLPTDAELSLGPDASAVGWIFMYALVDESGKLSVADLRSLQDWNVRFALESVPGVAEVASLGGFEKQYQVVLDPEKLRAQGLSVQQVVGAIARSNRDVGGRVVESSGRELYVQGRGYVATLADLDRTVVGVSPGGVRVLLSDVASVEIGPDIRRGVADLDGRGEAAAAVVVARQGENALRVIDRVKERLASLSLPEGVKIVTAYDRAPLIRQSVATLRTAILEEMIILAILLLVFLLHVRSVLVPLLVLPVAVATTFLPLHAMGVTLNIMSLAGIIIAIGDMVDAVVLLVENAATRIEKEPDRDRTEVVLEASKELGGALVASLLLIAVSFLPIFTLQAQEGRLFGPLALTKTFAMLCAALFTATLAPALAVLLLRGRMPREASNPVNRALRAAYRPVVRLATRHPWPFVAAALVATALTVPVYRNLGREFMPPLHEEAYLSMPVTLPGISVEEARNLLQRQDAALMRIPEVVRVLGKAGRADTATDPAPLSMLESTIIVKPRSQWRAGLTSEQLVAQMRAAIDEPGVQEAFTMPIKARVDMLTTGIRTPVGVKVLGRDLAEIEAAALRIEETLRQVPGTRSVYAERQQAGVFLEIAPRREDVARLGASIDDVMDVVELGLGGMPVGRIYLGRERYSLIARFGRDFRADESSLARLPIVTPGGTVPLGTLADITRRPAPAMLVDEGGRLAAYVYVDPGDRDLGGYVDEARSRVASLGLPRTIGVTWSGQYEFLERAQRRMAVMVPITIALVFLLTWLALRSAAETAIVLMTLPFAVLGSIWFLSIADYRLSIAAWVSMIALIGIGAETGTVLAVYMDVGVREALGRGQVPDARVLGEVAADAASGRMRGIVLALAMNLLGLLPVLFSQGVGADMSRRMAGPMFGGLVTLTIMTTLVLPAAWTIWRRSQLRRGVLARQLGIT